MVHLNPDHLNQKPYTDYNHYLKELLLDSITGRSNSLLRIQIGGDSFIDYSGKKVWVRASVIKGDVLTGDDAAKTAKHYGYYANYGWVDWYHALSDQALTILKQLRDPNAKTYGGNDVISYDASTLIHQRTGYSTPNDVIPNNGPNSTAKWIAVRALMGNTKEAYNGVYIVRADVAQKNYAAIGLAIWEDLSRRFESLQGKVEFWRQYTSAYSMEDLPSNIIAFYRMLSSVQNGSAPMNRAQTEQAFGLTKQLTQTGPCPFWGQAAVA